ncbi:L-aspartate oxidase [Pseudohongiella sp.]|uniref:L-aspartate oxidase n=1 Tax=marine sediment metagenome TaxID=412755 RepID=A0A0F9YEI9_9ZZZZ|nr:L-aspartate oxidase [Pseudohongiella sp.]HDZ09864.1 L-aspartate oxidase [Pseudohongiella sp.]HEA61521.1 L-aspartate oxidase [Pseudohongiella sp.]
MYDFDILIIGSGAAGLSLALKTAEFARVAVLSKGTLSQGATYWAQGGIAAVLDENDSVDAHIADTLDSGAGLCDVDMVRHIVEHSQEAIAWLVEQGVPFTLQTAEEAGAGAASLPLNRDNLKPLHLTQEGGHSHRRIIHATDATGRAVFETLRDRALNHPGISLFENRLAVDVITREKLGLEGAGCVGAYVYCKEQEKVELFRARFVVLASGGASKAYLYTTNPDSATGDGIAMAWRAGCPVANMEFNQFHPTCLYHPHARSFLITEALRGEGATLELPDGTRFMPAFDSRGELAPRDIVARAIDHEMKRLGCDCVYLNITHKSAEFITTHFPTIYSRCLDFGIDITKDRIPVVPAAHYTCGGVVVDKVGQTSITNLYAIGETSCTGLHGANRMASNSLLECFVLAFGAADDIRARLATTPAVPDCIPDWDESRVTRSQEEVVVSHNWDELRRMMWDYVGIVRSDRRLQLAHKRIQLLEQEIYEHYRRHMISRDLLELRNLVLVARLIIESALLRKESRGLHFTRDYPDMLDVASDTVLAPPQSQV